MKRRDQLSQFNAVSLADLQREVISLQSALQTERVSLAFEKTKQVRNMRALRRQLARALTIAHGRLRQEPAGNDSKQETRQ